MSIFVSIASYRDDSCSNTIHNLFENAKEPTRIFVGICQQNNSIYDKDCLNFSSYQKYKNNIRIIRIPYYDAKGPVYARYLCACLLENEDYFLQIDSHTVFIKNWDEICISMINEIKSLGISNKPVISYYPKDITQIDNPYENHNTIPVIKGVDYTNGVFTLKQAVYTQVNKGSYIKTPYITGNFFFCKSEFLKEFHFDPTLDYLFQGEEILYSIKFYTYGWDAFCPNMNIVYHEYTRSNKPKYWDEPLIKFDNRKALKKVRFYLFNYDENNKDPYYYNYKLGKIRTIEDFYRFANIDINIYKKKTKRITIITIIAFVFMLFALVFYLKYLLIR